MVASIEYIESVIRTFAQAAEANRQTPAREGNVVVLTAERADEVMLTGDLHGHRRNFNHIKRIADLDSHPRRHLVLQEVCHGGPTYPQNGGCMSHTVLEDVAKLKVQYPDRVHFLMGNHELAELTDYPIQKNKQMLNMMFRMGLQAMYGPASEKVRESYFPFLKSCPLAVRIAGGVFVSHSIPEDVEGQSFDKSIFTRELGPSEYFDKTGSLFRLVWGRDYRAENAAAFAKLVGARVIVNGHEPCPAGFGKPNEVQVILDCCTDKTGYVLLPVDAELTQAEVCQRIRALTG